MYPDNMVQIRVRMYLYRWADRPNDEGGLLNYEVVFIDSPHAGVCTHALPTPRTHCADFETLDLSGTRAHASTEQHGGTDPSAKQGQAESAHPQIALIRPLKAMGPRL